MEDDNRIKQIIHNKIEFKRIDNGTELKRNDNRRFWKKTKREKTMLYTMTGFITEKALRL